MDHLLSVISYWVMENWLPVVGYEGLYEVSDHGRVRSVDRVIRVTWYQKKRAALTESPLS